MSNSVAAERSTQPVGEVKNKVVVRDLNFYYGQNPRAEERRPLTCTRAKSRPL